MPRNNTAFEIVNWTGYASATFSSLGEALADAGERIELIRDENARTGSLVPEKITIHERQFDQHGNRPVRRIVVTTEEVAA